MAVGLAGLASVALPTYAAYKQDSFSDAVKNAWIASVLVNYPKTLMQMYVAHKQGTLPMSLGRAAALALPLQIVGGSVDGLLLGGLGRGLRTLKEHVAEKFAPKELTGDTASTLTSGLSEKAST